MVMVLVSRCFPATEVVNMSCKLRPPTDRHADRLLVVASSEATGHPWKREGRWKRMRDRRRKSRGHLLIAGPTEGGPYSRAHLVANAGERTPSGRMEEGRWGSHPPSHPLTRVGCCSVRPMPLDVSTTDNASRQCIYVIVHNIRPCFVYELRVKV